MAASTRRLLTLLAPEVTIKPEVKIKRTLSSQGTSSTVQKAPSPLETALVSLQRLEGPALSLRSPDLGDYLKHLGGEAREEGWLAGVLDTCPDLEVPLLAASQRLQQSWLAWAAAHSTIVAKLRSPMGKAQETLGHIADCARKLVGLLLLLLLTPSVSGSRARGAARAWPGHGSPVLRPWPREVHGELVGRQCGGPASGDQVHAAILPR